MGRHFTTRWGMPATMLRSVPGWMLAHADLIEKRRELLNAGAGICFGELRFQYSPEIFDWIEVR